MSWWSKRMPIGDVSAFRTGFALAFGKSEEARGMAAFLSRSPDDQCDTVVISPAALGAAMGLSPGGWERVAKPNADGLRLIGGHSDALLWFGLSYSPAPAAETSLPRR
jgi:hypothetical protein